MRFFNAISMKFLIIQQKMIGDVLTSSILCEALKNRYKDCVVHYLVNENTVAVLKDNPFIDHLILYTPEIAGSRKLQKKLRKDLSAQQYDATIDVYSKLGSARMARATDAKKIIGYTKWYTKGFYTHLFRYHLESKTTAGLAIENRMKLLRAIDADFPAELKPKIYLSGEEIAFAKAQLEKHLISSEKPLFMISVLGSSPEKTYPLPYLAKVLDRLVLTTDCQLLFNYIPNQLEDVQLLMRFCAEETRKNVHIDLYGRSLRDFIALASQCDALIGNEGGAVNMAKAVDVPTFAIFSPWIRREAWALYENEQNHVVHLQDIEPEIYSKRSFKNIKKEVTHHYQKLTPEFVNESLSVFLIENNFKTDPRA